MCRLSTMWALSGVGEGGAWLRAAAPIRANAALGVTRAARGCSAVACDILDVVIGGAGLAANS